MKRVPDSKKLEPMLRAATAHLRLLCSGGRAAVLAVNAALWRVNGSTAREYCPCIRPFLRTSTRTDRSQDPFFKSSVWSDRESSHGDQRR